jgi:hypothetical protein
MRLLEQRSSWSVDFDCTIAGTSGCASLAYALLVQTTGQKLPSPITEKPDRGGALLPVVVQVIPADANPMEEWRAEQKAIQGRLEAWRAWWKSTQQSGK